MADSASPECQGDLSEKPSLKPINPCFGSGPCAKPPLWNLDVLKDAALGRSHRSSLGISKVQQSLHETREILKIPSSHHLALVSGSATAAMESLVWNLLGARPVGVLEWDVFSRRWAHDITHQLKLSDTHIYTHHTDLKEIDFSRDLVFTWNGSTSGLCIPSDPWIDRGRQGLTLCDATSAAFAIPLPWEDLDATAFSWQKGLGGEAGVGLIALGPRAVERLESWHPAWPIPYLYKLAYKGKLNTHLFEGKMLNTPSLLVIEDALYALKWAREIGGIQAMHHRTLDHFLKIQKWVEKTSWIDFLVSNPALRSPTTVCLKPVKNAKWDWVQRFCALLEKEGAGFDLKNHAEASPSIRIWAGPTVRGEDLDALFPWFDWAYHALET